MPLLPGGFDLSRCSVVRRHTRQQSLQMNEFFADLKSLCGDPEFPQFGLKVSQPFLEATDNLGHPAVHLGIPDQKHIFG